MMRIVLCILLISLFTLSSKANHISGGEMYYSLVSQSGNNYTYSITLKLFRDVVSTGPALEASQNLAIYDKATNVLVWNASVVQTSAYTLTLGSPSPCIIAPPRVSFNIALYTIQVTLPGIPSGYIITFQRCCRLSGITNLVPPSSNYGSTYTAEIPGTASVSNAPANNSAKFEGSDTVIICAGYPFQYGFNAKDDDGDSLSYNFCSGYTSPNNPNAPNPPFTPPYSSLNYQSPYSSTNPMGSTVSINPVTGIMSGTAPVAGLYVVTVCVSEFRNGLLIATQRKDLHIRVSDCDLANVTLDPNGYINCNDFTVSFSNLTPNALINSYFWDFGDAGTLADTTHIPAPSYTYPDTGVYTVKVVANRNQPCSDSTTAKVRVFPGFFPDFKLTASCINVPVQFSDLTTTSHGTVNSWKWDFGVTALTNDTSRLQNPTYTYTNTGNYNTSLIVGSSKGCRDTINKAINVIDKPALSLNFRDTLICSVDTLQLFANGTGSFTWTPVYNILNPTTAAPLVFPKTTSWYKVELNDNGCRNQDSVKVRVVNSVTLIVSNDTTICANDPLQLNAVTDGLQYAWSPSGTLNNPTILNPVASPLATTTYQINSRIGGCSNTKDITVTVVPRPFVNAGSDTIICYMTSAQLNGQMGGTSFTWSPSSTLSNAAILNPVASPVSTTQYILSAMDLSSGCPKPAMDTITVTVLPKVNAFAGNDTLIIANLPIQLKATGGVNYVWSPAMGLNNPNVADPVALLNGNPGVITYTVTVTDQAGCADTASISLTVFKTGPEIFVPTGFTPNSDGRNDVFRPIYVGMQSIDYFKVYDRWGKLIYSNNLNNGIGWDGTINGIKQGTGTFVWMVRAIDVLGKVHFKKGTVVLIR